MSTTMQDLDAARARARRAQTLPPAPQQTQSVPPPNPGAVAGNIAGTGAGYAAGNYINGLLPSGGAASIPVQGPVATQALTNADAPSYLSGFNTAPTGAETAPVAEAGTGYVGPVLGALAAAKGGYDTYQGMMNGGQGQRAGMTTAGAGIGTMLLPGIGTAAGAAVGNVAGYGLQGKGIKNDLALLAVDPSGLSLLGKKTGMLNLGKDGDQLRRDQVRKAMQQQGALDEGFNLSLADGTKFNIGLDGGGKFKGRDGSDVNPYNVDTSNPFANQAVAWADPIAAILTGGDPKLRSDFAGYFSNAAMSNAQTMEGVRANALNLMAAHKVDFATARTAVDSLLSSGKIDQGTRDAYMNSLGVLESGNSKLYDTRTAQQVQQAAQVAPVVPPSVPLAKPPANVPAATAPVPRPTQEPTISGQPISAFQKLIDEAKRRDGVSNMIGQAKPGTVMPDVSNGLSQGVRK